jgi:hypothetical protein
VLLTRPPLDPKVSFDLHVLGTPPAFILSQDQTLQKCPYCYGALGCLSLALKKFWLFSWPEDHGTVVSSPLTRN